MPGAGKSTLGVLLAKAIGYDFIDTDLLIQRQAGMPLGDYLHNRGYQALRQLEAEVIQGLNAISSVIATGGSAVYSDESMSRVKKRRSKAIKRFARSSGLSAFCLLADMT